MRQLLGTSDEIELVATCGDLPELEQAVADGNPDVVITDIRMPPTGTDEGLRAANRLRAERPGVGVVVLSSFAEPEYALALLENGAAGRAYLLKERVSDIEQLVTAIKEVARGGSVIDPRVVEVLVAARSSARDSPLSDLTPRETEVLSQVAQGKNNAGIASALALTDRAVEKHINAIFSKLELSEEPDTHRRVKATLVYLAQQRR
jgi:DNA-binding NarL/FixJ family response regulator